MTSPAQVPTGNSQQAQGSQPVPWQQEGGGGQPCVTPPLGQAESHCPPVLQGTLALRQLAAHSSTSGWSCVGPRGLLVLFVKPAHSVHGFLLT